MRFTKALKAKILAMDFVQGAIQVAITRAANESFDIGFDQGVETGREDYIPKSRALAAIETIGIAAHDALFDQQETIRDLRDDLQALTISNVNLRYELGEALDARDEAVSKLESIKYIVAPEAFDLPTVQEGPDYGDDEPPVQEVNDGTYDEQQAQSKRGAFDVYGNPLPDALPGCLGTLPDATGDTTELISQDVAYYKARLPQYRDEGI